MRGDNAPAVFLGRGDHRTDENAINHEHTRLPHGAPFCDHNSIADSPFRLKRRPGQARHALIYGVAVHNKRDYS
jgi:hypothetical protein